MAKSTTDFLFSWGHGEDPAEETDLHYTENYFSGLANTQYFYDYDNHTFPPLQAFKNLFDSLSRHTSVRITEIEKTCTSAKIMVTFCGQKPYRFDIYKDSVLYHSYISAEDTISINLNDTGTYRITNVFDNNNIQGRSSDDYSLTSCLKIQNFINTVTTKLVAFPNPFSKQFNLYVELATPATLDIFDATGRKIKSEIIENGNNVVNMEGTRKGIYILKDKSQEQRLYF